MSYTVEIVHLSKRGAAGLEPSTTTYTDRDDAERHLRWAIGDLVMRSADGFRLVDAGTHDDDDPGGLLASARFANDALGVRTEVVLRLRPSDMPRQPTAASRSSLQPHSRLKR